MMISRKPEVVVIGGGTGLPVILRGLKKYPINITAIVTVADDGGSSGRLREELHIPPPGDIRNVMAALSNVEPLFEEVFQHRFQTSNELSGHSLGNLMIAALASITGNFAQAIQEMCKVLNVSGKVLPAADQSVVLHAEMTDGSIITGESNISQSRSKIKQVFLTPDTIKPLPETVKAIRNADMIVLSPGSLYTSILPNLLVPELGEEVCKARAKKVLISNIMTQPGETDHFTASDHLQVIYDHMECSFIHTAIVNSQQIPRDIQRRYLKKGAKPVVFDKDRLRSMRVNIVNDEIIKYDKKLIRHDTDKVAKILYNILINEAKKIVKI